MSTKYRHTTRQRKVGIPDPNRLHNMVDRSLPDADAHHAHVRAVLIASKRLGFPVAPL